MGLRDSLVGYMDAIKGAFRSPFNAQGNMLAYRNGEFTGFPTIKKIGFVETTEEMNFQQSQRESFATVFDNWQRISRAGGLNDDANTSELTAWTYNATTDQIVCQINSATLIGFISDQRYNNYVLEVVVDSTSGDDDYIGVCLAHTTLENGDSHILTAMRAGQGRAPLVIDKNYNGFGTSAYEFARVYSGLQWPDGTVATAPIANGTLGGWSALPSGHKLKVTREDDIITIETTLNDGSYHGPAKTVIDLSADPELEIFRGSQRYGYVCQSQPNSTWSVLERSGDRLPIVDVRDNSWYEYENGTWVQKGSGLDTLVVNGVLQPNWLHFNNITGRAYFLEGNHTLTRIE